MHICITINVSSNVSFSDKKAHFFVNTANAGSGSLNVAIDGPSKVNMNCHETEDGYEFTYIATEPGNYLISITFGGNFHIVGSPFTVRSYQFLRELMF